MVSRNPTAVVDFVANTADAESKIGKLTAGVAGLIAVVTTAVTAAGGLIAASTVVAAGQERRISEVNTLLRLERRGFKDLQSDILNLTTQTSRSLAETTEAAYQAVSARVSREDLVPFLQAATDAAVAGLTEINTAVDVSTSLINAYRLEASEAVKINDMLFETVRLGKLRFENLANSLPIVALQASNAGIAISEISAALADLTAKGAPASQSAQYLRQFIVQISQPTQRARRIAKELGLEFGETAFQGRTLGEVAGLIVKTARETEYTIRDLVPRLQSAQVALSLGADGGKAFSETLQTIESSAGSTKKAMDIMAETTLFKYDVAMSKLNVQMSELGENFLPLVTKGLTDVNLLLDAVAGRPAYTITLDIEGMPDYKEDQAGPDWYNKAVSFLALGTPDHGGAGSSREARALAKWHYDSYIEELEERLSDRRTAAAIARGLSGSGGLGYNDSGGGHLITALGEATASATMQGFKAGLIRENTIRNPFEETLPYALTAGRSAGENFVEGFLEELEGFEGTFGRPEPFPHLRLLDRSSFQPSFDFENYLAKGTNTPSSVESQNIATYMARSAQETANYQKGQRDLATAAADDAKELLRLAQLRNDLLEGEEETLQRLEDEFDGLTAVEVDLRDTTKRFLQAGLDKDFEMVVVLGKQLHILRQDNPQELLRLAAIRNQLLESEEEKLQRLEDEFNGLTAAEIDLRDTTERFLQASLDQDFELAIVLGKQIHFLQLEVSEVVKAVETGFSDWARRQSSMARYIFEGGSEDEAYNTSQKRAGFWYSEYLKGAGDDSARLSPIQFSNLPDAAQQSLVRATHGNAPFVQIFFGDGNILGVDNFEEYITQVLVNAQDTGRVGSARG